LFTKGLDKIAFERLQKQLMGWWPPFVLWRGSIGGILLPTLLSYLPSILPCVSKRISFTLTYTLYIFYTTD
jgi:hypothetical protein